MMGRYVAKVSGTTHHASLAGPLHLSWLPIRSIPHSYPRLHLFSKYFASPGKGKGDNRALSQFS